MSDVEVESFQAPRTQPYGYWLLKPGDPNRDVAEKLLRTKTVTGLTIRVPWSEVNPKPREFSWREIDQNLNLCQKVGKPAKLLIQTGRDGLSPTWLPGQWIGSGGKTSPAPWSPQLADAFAVLCDAIGKQYQIGSPIVAHHITGPTWPSAEMHPMPGLKHQKGYSVTAMREAWRDAIISANTAFPQHPACLSISVKQEADAYVRDVINAARSILASGCACSTTPWRPTRSRRPIITSCCVSPGSAASRSATRWFARPATIRSGSARGTSWTALRWASGSGRATSTSTRGPSRSPI